MNYNSMMYWLVKSGSVLEHCVQCTLTWLKWTQAHPPSVVRSSDQQFGSEAPVIQGVQPHGVSSPGHQVDT